MRRIPSPSVAGSPEPWADPPAGRRGRAAWLADRLSPVAALFGSSATLLCCALPSFVGAVAGTAAIGALVSGFPWLLPLARHKDWVFLGAGVMLAANVVLQVRARTRSCAPGAGKACAAASRFARRALVTSIVIYLLGAYFAYGRFLLAAWG